ncbi:hypothetical protein [Aliidiomarina soli]|uniref:Lipoprotein n=1 Tax=Aliidiomarina soli TaxID=1928574 RepID=A0A432WJF5_9GAMM|nr:hypothetical protein [Aliidiomarina soli]RUO33956.1 hypothetical protein CWE14_05760 [Aliidiomarina soli]
MWLVTKLSVAAVVIGLTACAGNQGSQYEGTRLVIDWDQVNRVEQSTRGNASLFWVNYPRKRIDAEGRVVERINQHGEVIARYSYDDENDEDSDVY